MALKRLFIDLGSSRIVFLRGHAKPINLLHALRQTDVELLALLRSVRYDHVAHAQLRVVYQVATLGGDFLESFEDMAAHVAASLSRGLLRAYRIWLTAADGITSAVRPSNAVDDTPVPFLDDDGNPVLDVSGKPMVRPAGLPPRLFVDQGIADGHIELDMILHGGASGALGYQIGALRKFKQWGEWDAQRAGGKYHPEFVDYATVVIGLYSAASGCSRAEILEIENIYAALNSRYPTTTLSDRTYTHLPARNVANTNIGYQLFELHRIRPTDLPPITR